MSARQHHATRATAAELAGREEHNGGDDGVHGQRGAKEDSATTVVVAEFTNNKKVACSLWFRLQATTHAQRLVA